MDQIGASLRELHEMDELALRRSPVHGLCPLCKLIVTVTFIVTVVSFPKYALTALVPMALYPVLLFQLSGIPVSACFRKLRLVLPLVLAVGLLNPFFDRAPLLRVGEVTLTGGMISMITLMVKGVLCLTAAFLLAATTPIDALCAALRRIRVPETMVTLLLLTYRYVGVLAEEAAVMTDAYSLRAPGQKGIHISAWGSFLGQLLLRSMDRAEELYAAMLLRGYHGAYPHAGTKPCVPKDAAYALCCVAVFLLLRRYDLARLLGSLFVR